MKEHLRVKMKKTLLRADDRLMGLMNGKLSPGALKEIMFVRAAIDSSIEILIALGPSAPKS